MNNVFNRYSEFYDLVYNDKDYINEVEYILTRIYQNHPNPKRILEYGSGTGKHGCLLAEKGFELTGIELSKNMFEKATELIAKRGLQKKFKLFNGDISEIRIENKFDVVISLFHVISYLTANNTVENTFQNAAHHLSKNGLFIFDIWYAPAVLILKPQYKLKEIESDTLKIYRFTNPELDYNNNVVDVNFKFVVLDKTNDKLLQLEETHRMRYFSIPEIEYFAKKNSFEVLRAEEFLTGYKPSENTWGVCFILRKI